MTFYSELKISPTRSTQKDIRSISGTTMIRHHMSLPYRPTIFKDNFNELANLLRVDVTKLSFYKINKKVTPIHKLQQPKK